MATAEKASHIINGPRKCIVEDQDTFKAMFGITDDENFFGNDDLAFEDPDDEDEKPPSNEILRRNQQQQAKVSFKNLFL